MKLEGIHHITAITGDAPQNVDFYAGCWACGWSRRPVNQDQPNVYHLFYADEEGDPGSDLTFFEFPGTPPGRAGAGMVHRVVWRVGSHEAIDFWERRLARARASRRDARTAACSFSDPEGLDHELLVPDVPDAPLTAEHPEIPAEHALQGFHAARAYVADPERSRELLRGGAGVRARATGAGRRAAPDRGGLYIADEPPPEHGLQGAGQRPPHRLGVAQPTTTRRGASA